MVLEAKNTFNPKYTRAKETATYFATSRMTLYRWRKEKDFPQPVQRGRVVLYDIAAIDKWLIGREA